MAYVKTVYANNNPPALNAANLNNMENEIYNLSYALDNKIVTGKGVLPDSDLDKIKSPGVYWHAYNDAAASNAPTTALNTSSFVICVYKTDMRYEYRVSQMFIPWGVDNPTIYFRTMKTTSAFGTWSAMVRTTDLDSIVSTLRSEIAGVDSKISALEAEVITKVVSGFINKTYPNYEKLSGYYTSDAGALVENESYDSYSFYIYRDMEIYFADEAGTSNYISIVGYSTNTYNSSTRLFTRKKYQSGVENTLPQSNSKLSMTKGQYILISIPAVNDFHLYGYKELDYLNNDILFNTNQISKIQEISAQDKQIGGYIQYQTESTTEGSSEQYAVYIPTGENYIKYRFVHSVSQTRNANMWRMGLVDLVDSNFETIIPLSIGSEWECALKLQGRSDFSGGYAHGDEIGSSLLIFVDGELKQSSDLLNRTPFEEVRLVTFSTLYDPNDSTTIIANHGAERIFFNKELKINQTINWLHAEELDTCYLCMFGPRKKADNIDITTNYYTDAKYDNETIPNPVGRTIQNCKNVSLFADSGYFANVRVEEYPENANYAGNGNAMISDNNGNNYNKTYFVIATAGSVSVGDRWKSTSVYKIEFSKNMGE